MTKRRMEDDVFRKAMAGVKPLKHRPVRPVASARRTTPSPGQLRRREAAVSTHLEPDRNHLHTGEVAQLAPHDVVEFKKDGVQPRVLRKLQRGRYPVEGRLDLHHFTVREAREAVYHFLTLCRERGRRCVAIVHGRGEFSATPARLKSHVVHWLREVPDIVAYASAPARDGGSGALYVLLRIGGVRDTGSRVGD